MKKNSVLVANSGKNTIILTKADTKLSDLSDVPLFYLQTQIVTGAPGSYGMDINYFQINKEEWEATKKRIDEFLNSN